MMNRIEKARQALARFEDRFRAEIVPAGAPDRRNLQRAACAEAHQRACLPRNIRRRLALVDAIGSARKSERLRQAWALRKAEPGYQLRQKVFKTLRAMGFRREKRTSGKSVYYIRDGYRVRISDHDVPDTPEREYNCQNGGFGWAHSPDSLVINQSTTELDAACWLVGVRSKLRRGQLRIRAVWRSERRVKYDNDNEPGRITGAREKGQDYC